MDKRTRAGKLAQLGQEVLDRGGTQIEAIAVMIAAATERKTKKKETPEYSLKARDVLRVLTDIVPNDKLDCDVTPPSSFAHLTNHLIAVQATPDGINNLAVWIRDGGLSWWSFGTPNWLNLVKHFQNWYAKAQSDKPTVESLGGKIR